MPISISEYVFLYRQLYFVQIPQHILYVLHPDELKKPYVQWYLGHINYMLFELFSWHSQYVDRLAAWDMRNDV